MKSPSREGLFYVPVSRPTVGSDHGHVLTDPGELSEEIKRETGMSENERNDENKYLPKKPEPRQAAAAFGMALVGLAACLDKSLIPVAAFPALLSVMAAAWPGEITPKVAGAGLAVTTWAFAVAGAGAFSLPALIMTAIAVGACAAAWLEGRGK